MPIGIQSKPLFYVHGAKQDQLTEEQIATMLEYAIKSLIVVDAKPTYQLRLSPPGRISKQFIHPHWLLRSATRWWSQSVSNAPNKSKYPCIELIFVLPVASRRPGQLMLCLSTPYRHQALAITISMMLLHHTLTLPSIGQSRMPQPTLDSLFFLLSLKHI